MLARRTWLQSLLAIAAAPLNALLPERAKSETQTIELAGFPESIVRDLHCYRLKLDFFCDGTWYEFHYLDPIEESYDVVHSPGKFILTDPPPDLRIAHLADGTSFIDWPNDPSATPISYRRRDFGNATPAEIIHAIESLEAVEVAEGFRL